MVDESVRQASVTEVPKAILQNFRPTRISIEEHVYLAQGLDDACYRIQNRSICDICTWSTALLAIDHKNIKGLCSASMWNSSKQITQEKVLLDLIPQALG